MKTYIDYSSQDLDLNFWRTTTGIEVDFVLDNKIAIEVKATSLVNSADLRGLKAIRSESSKIKKLIIVCLEAERRVVDDIEILPLFEFLEILWGDGFLV